MQLQLEYVKGERDQAQGTRVLDKGYDLDQEVGEAHPIDGKESGGGGGKGGRKSQQRPCGWSFAQARKAGGRSAEQSCRTGSQWDWASSFSQMHH